MNNIQTLHPRWEELAAFDRGQLPDTEWNCIAEHVASCAQCATMLNTVPEDAFVSLLRTTVTAAPTPVGSDTPMGVGRLPAAAAIPEVLASHPRYRLLEPLGAGGMGVVFKAEHVLMGRVVALKVLRMDVANRPDLVQRFCQEVKTLAQLTHPNIVTAHDAEEVGGVLFLVMEFVDGESLDRILARSGAVPPVLATDWVRQVAEGLRFAHERGLVHRDLKPGNLILTPQGQVKILDFGLARFSGVLAPASSMTPTGVVIGTPAYVAPEQARDPQTADIRADLYSLGCTWYELLTGQPPFARGPILQQLLAHQNEAPTPVTQVRPDVPRAVVPILERLLAKNPAQRFQTPAELLAALDPTATQVLPQPRRRVSHLWISLAVAAAAACILLAAGLLVGLGCYLWMTQPRAVTPAFQADGGHQHEPNTQGATRGPDSSGGGAPEQTRLSARDQAVAWLKANNAFGPDAEISETEGRNIDRKVGQGQAFALRLGSRLVKSKTGAVLTGRQNEFFVFMLPPDCPGLEPGTAMLTCTTGQNQEFARNPPVTLSELRVDNGLNLACDREVTGSLTFKAARPVSGQLLTLRMTVLLGKIPRYVYYYLPQKELADGGKLTFRFARLLDNERRNGPLVVLVELCAVNDPTAKAADLVLSNTVAELVMVHDKKP
jgi:predicted Ser/Thr protein kinase